MAVVYKWTNPVSAVNLNSELILYVAPDLLMMPLNVQVHL